MSMFTQSEPIPFNTFEYADGVSDSTKNKSAFTPGDLETTFNVQGVAVTE